MILRIYIEKTSNLTFDNKVLEIEIAVIVQFRCNPRYYGESHLNVAIISILIG